MQIICTLLLSALAIAPLIGQASEVFQLQYEGETAYATQQVDARYLGEYIQNKGLTSQHFLIKISSKESYLLTKNAEASAWDLESRQELRWGILCNEEGEPLVYKLQEFADGKMQQYPAMVFVYKNSTATGYDSKMLSLRNGSLYLDEAPKVEAIAAQ